MHQQWSTHRPVGSGQRHRASTTRGPVEDSHIGRLQTGTTVVALSADGGVVLAGDQRMSLGGRFVANKNVRKIEPVHPTAAVGISGAVGPAQRLLQSIRAEASLYESRRGEALGMPALARASSHLVRGLPVQPLLAGVDEDGPHVYELDGGGSVLADRYAATGSGLQVAYGVLEGRFDPDASLEDAEAVAVDAVLAACERDTASGDGVTVATITTDGVAFEGTGESDAGEGTARSDDSEGVA